MKAPIERFYPGGKFRAIGKDRYRGTCSVCDRNTLQVTEAEDGKLLLKCWAGCDNHSILAALGLSWGDLFPDNGLRPDPTYRQRRQAQARANAVHFEFQILRFAAADLKRGRRISPTDAARVELACQRIEQATGRRPL
ncbi:hypothetical protein [Microbulbifer sp. ARAS458-1]|uniref:hypothetical protein n=1 Tax=Microbulbifer sp. ARAS458-1 TaxID=3140242 RepID=UPI003877DE1F